MSLAEALIDIVAPHTCVVCGDEGELLCLGCWPNLGTQESAHELGEADSITIRADFSGVAKELVHRLKFGRTKAAAKTIAQAIAEKLPKLSPDTIIVPVPTATSRVRQRGYDQAALIAKELSRITELSYREMLMRIGQTRQVGASRKERQAQLRRSFIAKTNSPAYKVLLIDDVLTTGATLDAAIRTLKFAGVDKVHAAVFARSNLVS